MSKVIRLNNYTFAGATLRIEVYNQPAAQANQPRSTEGAGVAELLKGVLSRRYKEETKLMDLSALGSDPELVNVGMFGSNSTTSKFFPALMKVCDGVFTTEQQKTEAVLSVSLANNELTNLDAVTTLAETFPNLRNLDISNNAFKSIQDLSRWRMKFRKLEHLVITGNPMEHGEPTFMAELMKWFPNLRNIGTTQVRTEEEISAAKSRQLPIPTKPASFEDEADIGKNFLLRFFGSYDNDRVSIIRDYYDAQSTYSMSINTSAPRDPASKTGIVSWDRYIKGSRNLCKINHLHARVSREHQGQQSIADAWEKLPRTQHPDLMSEPEKWCIECQPLAGIPDGKTKGGVGGLIITVHGEFKEADDRARTPNTHIQRSFDRVFVLGPGANGGIRVVVDMITLRAYGGYAAFQPDQYGTPTPEPQGPEQVLMRLGLPPHWGSPAQEKTEEQVLKERMALELTTRTGMTIEYSGTCLEENGWDYEAACGAFEGAKANLPQEAFVRFDAWFREG